MGLGTAYVTGFRWALDHGYDYVFEMDADFSPQPRRPPEALQGLLRGRGRHVDRLPLLQRNQCGELAHVAHPDLLLRVDLRSHGARLQDLRQHRRLRVLQPQGPGSHRPERRQDERLRLPDRDEIHRPQARVQDSRSPRDFREPPARHLQDVRRNLRRGLLGRARTRFRKIRPAR